MLAPEMTLVTYCNMRLGLASALCFVFLTAGCLSPKKKITEQLPRIQSEWRTNVAWQAALPEQVLNWPQACSMLWANNLKLRRARNDITNNQESVRQVFQDLLPTLNLRSGVSKSIRDLSMTTLDDVTFSVDSFVNVPGLVSLNSRYFATRLGLARAKTLYQLTEREQSLELYKLFLDVQGQRELEAQLRSEKAFAESVQKVDDFAGQVLVRDIATRQLTLEKEMDGLQWKLSDVLGDRQHRWILTTNGWPGFAYETNPLPLSDTNRVAQLQMKLVAIELVGAWAQIVGIKLQYWPELNIFVTGPAVYQRINGMDKFWDASDIRLRADLFWRIDTRGYVARQLRQTRREQELQIARIRQEAIGLIDRLLAAQNLMTALGDQIRQIDQVIVLLERVPLPADFSGILKTAETNRSLRDQARKLRREMAELNALFWFVDEQQWSTSQ